MNEIIIHKGRVNRIQIAMGIDVSLDTLTSEIRTQPTVDATLIVAFGVSFLTDGTDGLLVLTLDDTDRAIEPAAGWMDLKRIVGTEAVPVFDEPLEVEFRSTVTA